MPSTSASATAAYELIAERAEPYLAIRLDYPGGADPHGQVQAAAAAGPGRAAGRRARPGVGLIGAGAFATGTLLPALRAAGFGRLVAVASASGLTATRAAQRHGFEKAVAGARRGPRRPGRLRRRDRHPARHARLARRPGPGGRPPRVVREASRADRGRARRGAGRVARVRPRARHRLQPPLVPGRGRGAAGAQRRHRGQAGRLPDRRRAGPRRATGTRTGGRAGGCSARYATSWTPRRRWSARRSRT